MSRLVDWAEPGVVGTSTGVSAAVPTTPSFDQSLRMWMSSGTSGRSSERQTPPFAMFVLFPSTSPGWIGPDPTPSSSIAIVELRRRSGWTWEQLASIFGVSRRSVHFWANGSRPNPENADRLQRVLAIVREVATPDVDTTRAHLLRPFADGASIFTLLCAKRDDEVLERLRKEPFVRPLHDGAVVRPRRRPPPLSPEERERRRASQPVDLLDALHDDAIVPAGRPLGSAPIPKA